MRASGVCGLLVYCSDYKCNHSTAPFVNCFTYAERGVSYQAPRATGHWRRKMEAIFNFLFRAIGRSLDRETVQTTIVSCGLGSLLLSLFLTQS
jgi:hypothetical protein